MERLNLNQHANGNHQPKRGQQKSQRDIWVEEKLPQAGHSINRQGEQKARRAIITNVDQQIDRE